VLSISAGKDADAIVRHLLPEVNAVTVTRAEPARSLSPSEVATAIRAAVPDVSVQVVPNPHLALRAAREELSAEDLLCVSGSIYLAGIARRVFCDAGSNENAAVSRRSGDA
jgi:dihydrofolate synthase/folylpolyglutamate synthase